MNKQLKIYAEPKLLPLIRQSKITDSHIEQATAALLAMDYELWLNNTSAIACRQLLWEKLGFRLPNSVFKTIASKCTWWKKVEVRRSRSTSLSEEEWIALRYAVIRVADIITIMTVEQAATVVSCHKPTNASQLLGLVSTMHYWRSEK